MSTPGKIETAANIATIGLAVLLAAALVKVDFLPAPSPVRRPPAAAQAGIGTSLRGKVPGIDWHANGRTLVLALSTECHFCKESTPFYRRLREKPGMRLRIVAVLPQSMAAAEQYLNSEGVRVDQVEQVQLPEVGIRGTPTMLLVDGRGIVTNIWTGLLRPAEQEQVLSVLRKG